MVFDDPLRMDAEIPPDLRVEHSGFILPSRIDHTTRKEGSTVATLVRWEPLSELATLQTELSRLMNGLSEGNGRNTQSWVPPVDVWETESDLVYAFDLPGISQDKIALDLHDDTLTVSGEREARTSGPRTGSSASSGATAASAAL